MNHTKVKLARKEADGYIIPLGAVNLDVVTDVGMVGCGAFDIAALNTISVTGSEGQAITKEARLPLSKIF